MGRRAHQPDPVTRRQVEALAGYGVPETDIAGVVGIDPKTLRKHYRDELKHGHVKANAKVAESLFRKATSDGAQSVTAAIFWLKTRAGWKETMVTELAARDQQPVLIVRTVVDPKSEAAGPISPGDPISSSTATAARIDARMAPARQTGALVRPRDQRAAPLQPHCHGDR